MYTLKIIKYFTKKIILFIIFYSTNKCNPSNISTQQIKIGTVSKVVQKNNVDADPGPTSAASASWKHATAVGCAAMITHCLASLGFKGRAYEYTVAKKGPIKTLSISAARNFIQWQETKEC